MSNPSFSNIDLWLFELAEGNLTPAQIQQLELFLLQHPELDVERDVWEMAKLSSTSFVYPEQEKLERRRPVAWFAVASTSMLVLTLVGATLFSESTSSNNQLATMTEDDIQNDNADIQTSILLNEENFSLIQSENKISDESTAAGNGGVYGAAENRRRNHLDGYISSGQVNDMNNSSNPIVVNTFNTQLASNGTTVNAIASNRSNYSNSTVNSQALNNGAINTNSAGTLPSNATLLSVSGLATTTVSQLENEFIAELVPYQPMTFDVLSDEDYAIVNDREKKSYGISSEEYHVSIRSRLNSFGRKVQRMMDNPIALKNFRDPHYHIPGMLASDVNMSSTGTMLAMRVQTNTRLQWFGRENQQMMNQLAIDGYAYGIRGGVGLQIYHGMYADGSINVASAAITYSPKLSINKAISIEPSLRFKMGNISLTHSKLDDVNDVELERGNSRLFFPEGDPSGGSLWYKDLGVGLMVNTEWFFVGAQLDNLFRHKDNVYANDYDNPHRADYHFVATIGTDWVSRKENLGLSPYLVYQKKERLSEAWLGANFRWNWFTLGAAISTNMEPAASIGLKFDHFTMTYNADFVESHMTGVKSLSHQLTLRFIGKPSRFGRRLLNL